MKVLFGFGKARILSSSLIFWFALDLPAQVTDVLTYHNDQARTGQALNEQILTYGSVNSNQFGKLWVLPTAGEVLAEPLYAAGVSIPELGMHNVLFVETEGDVAYAIDADSTNVLWAVSLLGTNEIPYQTSFCTITPQMGVTATPVIDRQFGPNGTIFIEAMSQDAGTNVHQRLHALDIATGYDVVAPVEIAATYPGTGDDSVGTKDIFYPAHYEERAALTLVNGVVYMAWSGRCDKRPYTCWVMGYDEYTLSQTSVINLEPNAYGGSIWNSDAGPAVDAGGNIYVTLGDAGGGDFQGPLNSNGFPVNGDYGCALVKLSTTNDILTVTDYFAPDVAAYDAANDLDLAAGGPLLLPDMADTNGITHDLVVAAGKDQNMYIADCSNMGKYNVRNNNALYQGFIDIFPGPHGAGPNKYGKSGGTWSMPAYFNGSLYFGPVNGPITAFPFQNAVLSTNTTQSSNVFGFPGATPSISANGTSNGIVWVVETVGQAGFEELPSRSAILHAYAATNLAVELYNSTEAANNRDDFGNVNDFVTPMIANGRVYVPSSEGIAVFGLFQLNFTLIKLWRATNFNNPSDVGAGANSASPAGDGVPNLVKYALGLSPYTQVTPGQLGVATLQEFGGLSYLNLTVDRAACPSDVSVMAETSADLQNWTVTNVTVLTNSTSQLIIMDNTPVSAGQNQFLQLLVQPNP
jgi:hypothetical protein